MDPNGSDALFDIIQKELNKIIEHGDALAITTEKKSTKVSNKKEENPITEKKEDQFENFSNENPTPRMKAGGGVVGSSNPENVRFSPTSENYTQLKEMGKKYKSTLEADIAAQTAALDSPRAKCIDADLQRMQMELQESYNLFQNISEKFETIDFSRLQKRIRDLNLNVKRDAIGSVRTDELKRAIDEGFKTNRLNELTNEMGEKFRKHPGEFANIPELSSFFQACTQLEHVLGSLRRQRTDVRDLEERMQRSAEISYNRVKYIKQQLAEDNLEDHYGSMQSKE